MEKTEKQKMYNMGKKSNLIKIRKKLCFDDNENFKTNIPQPITNSQTKKKDKMEVEKQKMDNEKMKMDNKKMKMEMEKQKMAMEEMKMKMER